MSSVKNLLVRVNDFFLGGVYEEAAGYLPPEPEADSPRATLGSWVCRNGRLGIVIGEGQYHVEVAWWYRTSWGWVETGKRNLMARSEVEVILQ